MRLSSAKGAALGALVVAAVACTPRDARLAARSAPPVDVAATSVEVPSPPPGAPEIVDAPAVEMERTWKGFGVSGCSYLAPTESFIGEDGGVDVVFHFHAGQMSDREIRESGVRGVFVSCGYGIGSAAYARPFTDPTRFGVMMRRLLGAIGAATQRAGIHLRHLALASWSAGFAAISRILGVPEWYEATDTVVLLDSLHARYVDEEGASGPARGADHVNMRSLEHFVRFARDAAAGKKTMVVTHSAIVPPDYASTTEATAALLSEVGVEPVDVEEKNDRGMRLIHTADARGLHVRGYRGAGPKDHFDHLHQIGDVLRAWVTPRWCAADARR